ncbi:MAG: hypothetical protein M3P93_06165 [Actinomycetota bacterium]|nr:hypothetical protein [Actinomycetota bacterium]
MQPEPTSDRDSEAAVSEVVLLGYPVKLWVRQQERQRDVLREFQIIASGLQTGEAGGDLPVRLVTMVDRVMTTYAAQIAAPAQQRLAALERGDDQVDLRYPVVPEARAVIQEWRETMAEVDETCRRGDLLVPPPPPEIVALRTWVLDEYLRQLDGEPPRRWDGPLS